MGVSEQSGPRAGPAATTAQPPEVSVPVRSFRFGTLAVPADRVLRFVRPVVGFPNIEHYAVIEDPQTAPVLWLQALGAAEVLLPVVDACLVTGKYSVELSDEEARELSLRRAEDARLLLVMTLHPDPSRITVNLRAPIVWNTRAALAMQLVLQDSSLPVHHPVRPRDQEDRHEQEVGGASADTP